MDEFDKEISLIEKKNPSEVNGELKSYFVVIEKPNGKFAIKWEKKISTHIRHKVSALVAKHYVAASN